MLNVQCVAVRSGHGDADEGRAKSWEIVTLGPDWKRKIVAQREKSWVRRDATGGGGRGGDRTVR